MVSIAIVEDDDRFASTIQGYLNQFGTESGIKFNTTRFTDGYAIVDGYRGGFDIILMDIETGLMDGMEAAREIRKTDQEVVIIFITNMAQFAIQGYSVSALDYVLKPVSYVAFTETIRKAVDRLQEKVVHYLTINYKDGVCKLKTSELYWVESFGHRLRFHSCEGDYESTVYTMKEIEEKLQPDGFMRASSGLLINLNKVTGTKNGYVRVDGQYLPLSRGRKSEFMAALVSSMVE